MAKQAKRICQDCKSGFIAGPQARYCPVCRALYRRKPLKYPLTPEIRARLKERYDGSVPGRVGELAAELGWPKHAIKRAAGELALRRPWPPDRRPWTADEEEYLRTWAGYRSVNWIGRQLGRGGTSVRSKLKQMRLSARVRHGYSLHELAACFGVDHRVVEAWIRRGYLKVNMQGTLRRHDIHRASETAVFDFITRHREEYVLSKVDQQWFLDLVLGTANGSAQERRRRREALQAGTEKAPPPEEIAERAAELRRDWCDERGVLAGRREDV